MRNLTIANLISLLCLPALGAAAEVSPNLQREVEDLKQQNKVIMERLDATLTAMEQNKSAAKPASRTHIGGYGELHYNNLDNKNPGGSDKKEIDFHRFVLFFGHDFTDRIRFHSEVELEHALVKDTSTGSTTGEVELEQAYIEFDIGDNQKLKGGLFLVPVGILNETHEPPTFYGVERNSVESQIIPSTWWEAGAMHTWMHASGLSVDVALHSGLKTSSASNYAIRSGRQKVSSANATDLAYTARVKWTGVAGLELAATYQHQSNIAQSTDVNAGSANLIETHAIWKTGPFQVRALYANWDLNGSGPRGVGADKQYGWYIEPSYRINPKVGLFARHSRWDNRANDSTDSRISQTDVGLNIWPHDNVVIKLDYQNQDAPSGTTEFDGVNLGIGYQF